MVEVIKIFKMESEASLCIATMFYRHDYIFNNPRTPKMINIYSAKSGIWTYSDLQILLNEMHTFMPNNHPFQCINSENGKKLVFHIHDPNKDEYQISIVIQNSIFVSLSVQFLKDFFI